jgi:hypothetical protein
MAFSELIGTGNAQLLECDRVQDTFFGEMLTEARMLHAIGFDRVRANSSKEVNAEIDAQIMQNVDLYKSKGIDAIIDRIYELEREWDIERVLEMLASSFSLTGIILGRTKNKLWLLLPPVVLSFLLLHAVQGWCPPLPILRRLGFRTREEIEYERYALRKVLEGQLS